MFIIIIIFDQNCVVFCTNTDAPLVIIPHAETGISVGDTMEIVCHADSSPLSDITWTTAGKEATVCRVTKSCPVVVGNVSAGQQVNYTCSARNSVGFDENSITFEGKGTLQRNV